METFHTPVLADEVATLAEGHRRMVDCTVGGGGHAVRLWEAGGELLLVDQDPDAIAEAQRRLDGAPATWVQASFADPAVVTTVEQFRPDFILLDLGVSAHQIDADDRGFSFRPNVALDMRMAPHEGETAAQLLNNLNATALERIFRDFADEPRAHRLAAEIVRRRRRRAFAVSTDLVDAIRAVLGKQAGPADFARLFQAMRIAVNAELAALETALPGLFNALVPGGLLVVISYHSGEDRLVKHTFREWARTCICPATAPLCTCRGKALGTLHSGKPVRPGEAEIASNPRARSARLRAIRKAYES